jgi:bifunctional oligoribonuclease and PAP phosphatase NrnA
MEPCRSVRDILGKATRVLVVTHVKPDGDAIGSTTALILGLRCKGIGSRLLLFDPPPAKYAYVLEENQIDWFRVEKTWPADVDLRSFDALAVVDTGTWSQLPGLKEHLANWKAPKLVLDHHLTQEDWADVKWVDTGAAAAGEIIADLFQNWEVRLDASIATVLFLAISTDTGWFQFSNTTPKTLRLAATLMEAGVDVERIYHMAFQNERPPRLALMSRALNSLELMANNRLAVMSLGKQDFEQTGADGGDTENLINLPLQVASVEVSIFLSEQPGPGAPIVRVSLRSKGKLDVAAFAQRFKGGGHARAAGLKMDGDLSSARRAIAAALAAELAAPES